MKDTIDMARESHLDVYGLGKDHAKFVDTLKAFEALVRADERDRVCTAIKAEDDYCVDEGDYMLDSDDCIAVAKGEWVRPDYAVAIRARGATNDL